MKQQTNKPAWLVTLGITDWETEQQMLRLVLAALNGELRSVRKCRACGCTDHDCRTCIERTGGPCYWVDRDLCSACADRPPRFPALGAEGRKESTSMAATKSTTPAPRASPKTTKAAAATAKPTSTRKRRG